MLRILCLHGSGSSGEILKRQIANICSYLPTTYTFDFIDAPVECDPAPDLRDVYPGPYYRFFDQYSGAAMQEAIKIVEEVVDEDGPYDGVVGFSQGAAVAAAYIARQQMHGFFEDAPFKMAVFFCTALIHPDSATSSKMADTMGKFGQVGLPTLHIIGRKDLCKAQSLELVKLCKRDSAQVLLNDGGHDIPRDVENTRKIALAIERVMHVALSG